MKKVIEENVTEVTLDETKKNRLESLRNPNIESYISLKNINKVYPNGFQAVYDFDLDIDKNEFIVFVGPSGCGKSTTLRMIAGLEDITAGDFYIDQIYSNNLTPKDRDIAMVFQNYALYPHMTVYDNMAFGLKMRHVPKDEIEKRIKEAAEILDLTTLLDRKPRQLSGGQMQRVALGRTIVRKAKVFLMDEPLSNLDAKLRVNMRSEIIKLHQKLNTTTIYVTHDQTEAMTMATRIVVMNKGHIQQIGTPDVIYNNPTNKFVASFIGTPAMNMIKVHYKDGTLTTDDGFSIKLSAANVKKVKKFLEEQIELLRARLDNLNYELELLPHAVDKKTLNQTEEEQETTEKIEFDSEETRKIKAHKVVSKAVLKGSNQFSWKKLFKKNKLPTYVELKEKMTDEINELIKKYYDCLSGEFDCTLGIRPEHIELAENKILYKNPSTPVEITLDIAELLGNEYYIHSNKFGIDFIARINSDKKVKVGDKEKVIMNVDRIHLFDDLSDKAIF